MQLPLFLIKIYHKIPLPKKIKKTGRYIFYFLAVPLIKIKRRFFIEKDLDFSHLSTFQKNSNFIGIGKFHCSHIKKSFILIYPLVKSIKLVLKEVFDDEIYFKYSKIEKNDVVIDAGANIGTFSILSSLMTGEDGMLISLEPDPFNIEFLKWNKDVNRLVNMRIIEKALWSKKERLNFYVNELYSAASSLYSGHAKQIMVEGDTLDNILLDLKLGNRSIFLKMDIEGAEAEVIKGMEKLLKYPKLKGVIAAYHKISDGNNFIKTYTLIEPILKKNGFKVVNEAGFLYFWR
jgi:FkbM family methyltransferase